MLQKKIKSFDDLRIAATQHIKEKNYWQHKLSGERGKSSFPIDRLGSEVKETGSGLAQSVKFQIQENLFRNMIRICNSSDNRLYMILLSGLYVLLYNYSGNSDIVIGSPVYKQNSDTELINSVVALRIQLGDDITFKQLLLRVKESLAEAIENYSYPIELLPELLRLNQPMDDSPLFNTAILLQNIHDIDYLNHLSLDIIFSFQRSGNSITGEVLYNGLLYRQSTIERIVSNYTHLLFILMSNLDAPIFSQGLLSEEEKSMILNSFNDTVREYSQDTSILSLFNAQVKKTPDNVAIVFEDKQFTYKEVDQKANQIAARLREKGIKPNHIVALMLKRSHFITLGILATLKAGGAYLPIGTEYPHKRIQFILKDSASMIVLATQETGNAIDFSGNIIYLDQEDTWNLPRDRSTHNEALNHLSDIAYIIYTSGTTGNPKGVMVEHGNLLCYLNAFIQEFDTVGEKDVVVQQVIYSFDAFVEELYPPLIRGAKIVVPTDDEAIDLNLLVEFMIQHMVTLVSASPLFLNEINKEGKLKTASLIISGGDTLKKEYIKNLLKVGRVYNTYGPTEATVCATYYECNNYIENTSSNIPIGHPISNYRIYIVDKNLNLLPIGRSGELCISGNAVTRGYLNRPELTCEKFVKDPYYKNAKIYKSGDLACWLPDGNIEFLGRIDHQIKVRGFRIELGEIENRLLNHPQIIEAVVLANEDKEGEKYLCAYFVTVSELDVSDLIEYLVVDLPDYMIPSFFIPLEKIPLTSSGKIDRKALPLPTVQTDKKYIAPRNMTEAQLVRLWADVLNIPNDVISIDSIFFQLGGHSLSATVLASKIHKEMNIIVPLAELFKTPTIRGLAEYIKGTAENIFESLMPVEDKKYYVLSFAQQRMYILQQIELNSTAYNMPEIIPLPEEVDIGKLEVSFKKLIKRHDGLRTSFHMINDQPQQKVHQEVDFKIEKIEESQVHQFIRVFDLSKAPLLRVAELKTLEGRKYLLVDMHHIISDGVSSQVMREDFIAFYEGIELSPLRIQYKDFAQWQNSPKEVERLHQQMLFWVKEFAGEIPVLEIPTDYPRPISQSFEGNNINFEISVEETRALNTVALQGGATLFMILMAALNILLAKLSGQEEIIIGTPIAGRRHSDLEKIIGMFVNTLVLRNYPTAQRTFNDFLHDVRERVLKVFENQEYPFEGLVDKLSLPRDLGRNPLFDVLLVLQNINIASANMDGVTLLQSELPRRYENIGQSAKFDLTFTAAEIEHKALFSIKYCTRLFKKETIQRFITYFKMIIISIINDPHVQLQHIDVLSDNEKEQLLYDFNNTTAEFPIHITIHQLFEEQVEKTPGNSAVIGPSVEGGNIQLSYHELNEKSNRLAICLKEKGAKSGSIVAIMLDRSSEMIIAIMGIFKAGGAYLPINPEYPVERIDFMLKDSETMMLVTSHGLEEKLRGREEIQKNIVIVIAGDSYLSNFNASTFPCLPASDSSNLAYIIYTSGSTGNPKGVIVEHRSVINLVYGLKKRVYRYDNPVSIALISPIYFDASIKQIFPALLMGHRLVIVSETDMISGSRLIHLYQKYNIIVSDGTPSHLILLLDSVSSLGLQGQIPIERFVIGGDILPPSLIRKLMDSAYNENDLKKFEIINAYGPTECCDVTTTFTITRENINNYHSIPIGTPLDNVKVYIIGKEENLQPIGVTGELCISGSGLSRGYLNQPELTAERFIDFTLNDQSLKLYRSGDLARWLPDGNIEFSGRIDHQVKIRGFRVELGEIENRLLKHPLIKEAVLIAWDEEDGGGKYLSAYFVSDKEYDMADIREFLLKGLPDYMIPSYFVRLEQMPLTPNGKVDRKALPKPVLKIEKDHVAPRNGMEAKLVGLWAELLNISPEIISIDSNFFQLGGHSLKATILASRVHKELNVLLPLAELFKKPTIRGLSEYILGTVKNIYESIMPTEAKEYYSLSFAQQRMFILQQIELSSTAYNMPEIIPLPEEVDIDKLAMSFNALIKRHDSLRTSFHMIGDQPLQKIHREAAFEIERYDVSAAHQFVRAFDLSHAPLLRVAAFKTAAEKNYLIVDMHHIISDGISIQVLKEDFNAFYEGKELAPLRIQYKDFAEWQNSPKEVERLNQQMSYWLKEFEGEIPVLEIPMDYPRPMIQSFEGNSINFEISVEETRALNTVALQGGATLFMILMAAVNILLAKLSGQEEIIIGTPTAGRRHADLEKIIGMFVNTLALRNYPTGEQTFNTFLHDVKERVLNVFENQEYPFEGLVDKLSLKRDMGRNPLFDVMFVLQNMNTASAVQDEESQAVSVPSPQSDLPREYENIAQTAKFDLTFTAMESQQGILFSIQYCTKLFKQETIQRFIAYFKKIVLSIVNQPDIELQQIDILSAKEKEQLLVDFNQTDEVYSKEKPIYRLFEEQVERTPGNIALSGPSLAGGNSRLSYRELNEKSNQLAHTLRKMGITHNTVVGIMIRRSTEMIISILGILKSGGAYLPIDYLYPMERKSRMLKDSAAKVLLTEGEAGLDNIATCECIDIRNQDLFDGYTGNPGIKNQGDDLIYTIFTSGSTGFPKGAGVYHRGFMNLMNWYLREFGLNSNDSVLLLTSLSFDLTQKNIYAPLAVGGILHIPGGDYFEPSVLLQEIGRNNITWINCTPGMFYKMVEVKGNRYLLSSLRYVFLGGEPISVKMMRGWLESDECNAELVNTYGPTECSDVCTYYRLTDWKQYLEGVVPTGKPVYNTQLYILDRYLQMTPLGVAGELFIAGAGVGAGYINHSEMTREKFTDILLDRNSPVLCYRTGDLARWLPDGNIEFLGRIDFQLKIRGFRVELGEIENRLLNYPGIKEAVVLAQEDDDGDKSLCAYLVSAEEYEVTGIREFLLKGLPDYMVPSYFIHLEKIPLNPNGKVDRKALPKPEVKAEQNYVAPRNGTEAKLVGLWAELLNIQPEVISIDSNFFQLGGHSLKATVLASRVHRELNVLLPLAELFKKPTIRGLSEYILATVENIYESIMPAEEKENYVLSFAQQRMYILQQMELNSTAYNIPEIIPLPEAMDIDKLEVSFNALINRHESLRTSFHMIDDQPLQKVHRDVSFAIQRIDEAGAPQFVRAFDLSQAPLLRVAAFKTVAEKNYLIVDMHHIISDGISIQVLKEDFNALYEGKELAPLRIQYKDFAEWQNSPKEVERLNQQMSYWLKEFEGEIPVLEIPMDYPRPMIQSFEGNSINFEISVEETRALNTVALQGGATLFMILMAAVNILLAKLSGQEEIIIGTPTAGRRHADLEKIIGMFVNTLALRNYPTGEQTFNTFLHDVKERVLNVFENQEYPFEGLVDKLSLKRDMGRNPLFDVLFALQNMNTAATATKGENQSQIDQPVLPQGYEDMPQTAKFDVTFTAIEVERKILFTIQYCTKLFKKESIQRFSLYFKRIVAQIIAHPGVKLKEIEITLDDERRQLLTEFNSAESIYPNDKTIHRLFAEQVLRTPDNTALILPDIDQVSYQELENISNGLATLLREQGVQTGTIVGIMADRSIEMIIGLLGILKAGAAYLPLNPKNPANRTHYMIKDSRTQIVLTQHRYLATLSDICQTIAIEPRDWAVSGELPHTSPDSYAYLIYTSGSTGNPKGVPITHANFSPLVHWGYRNMRLSQTDRVLQNLSFFFDWSAWEIFLALTTGAELYITDEEVLLGGEALGKFIGENSITVLHITPSQFQVLVGVEADGKPVKLDSLTHLCLGAEKLTYDLVTRSIKMVSQNCRIYNMYGPTEATIIAAILEINRETVDKYKTLSSVPIGMPVGNTQLIVLDKYFNLCPPKVTGELYIGGEGLSNGYLNNPELTAGKFIMNPACLYKTGDFARWLPDGAVEFLGRIDFQVKIRGYRIELGEIENKILEHQRVKAAVVIVKGETLLCAYIVPEGHIENEVEFKKELKEFLTSRLPGYMVPSFIALIKSIALTPNGKVDLRALPQPEAVSIAEYIAPRDVMEEKLVEIWIEVLGKVAVKAPIGINANFFELGGHSLKATVLASKIHKELNVIVPLAALFKTPTIFGLSEYIKGTVENSYESIMPTEAKEYYTLSFAQQRMFILQQIELSSTAYNMPEIIPLPEEVNIDQLTESFNALIKRHDSLRTSFHMIDDHPLQKVHREVSFAIQRIDEAGAPQFVRAFDLSQAPLLRVAAFKTVAEKNYLIVDMHHIISDGISIQVLKEDFNALYEGKELAPLRIQYKDFAEWQNSPKEVERLNQQMSYWLKEFEGEIPVLEIPMDYPRPMIQSFEGNSINFEISVEETRALNTVALQGGATLFMILMAAVNILLAKLSGQEEIIIGTPTAGRRHADLEKIIGMFVNTLALRNYPTGEQTFNTFLHDVKERVLNVFENQEYPFEGLVDKLSLKRDMGRNPLFDVLFALQNMNTAATATKGENQSQIDQPVLPQGYEDMPQTAKFDVTFTAIEVERKILFTIQYCTKLFKKESIQRFSLYFKRIVAQIIAHPGVKLKEIEITLDDERRQLLTEFNSAESIYPNDKTIHRLFAEQVLRTPDNTALILPDIDQVSYQELENISNGLATLLREQGVQTGTIVGIMADRSIEMIIGLLGILKAGAAYLPLNPKNPANRTHYMIKDSRTQIVLTQHRYLATLSDICQTIAIEPRDWAVSGELPHTSPDSYAYLIYTSGSTGNPKGVPITHANFSPLVHWGYRNMRLSQTDRVLQNLSFFFDWSAWEIFLALTTGAELYITDEEVLLGGEALGKFIGENSITVLHITPSQFQVLVGVEADGKPVKLDSLTHLCLGAEKLTYDLVTRSIKMVSQNCRIYNMYGPTEATIIAAILEINRETVDKYKTLSSVPIGMPVGNTQLIVLDKYFNLCPPKVTGELYIGGEGLSNGYLNNPELTAGKFIMNPACLYKTGDFARWLPDGAVEFLGRIDFQVKIRGYRIELGEIENKILEHQRVKAAVVIVKGETLLCAYIVPEGHIENEVEFKKELKEFLTSRLPGYMVPSFIALIKSIALTPNGKVDLRALPQPEAVSIAEYIAPRNPVEAKLVEIWVEVLGKDAVKAPIGINANFFELGGHSLKATVLASKIHKELNAILPLAVIFKTPTIKDLGDYIMNTDRNVQRVFDGNLVPIKETSPQNNHLFLIHDGSGEVEGYLEFCKHLTSNFNCWGLRADRLKGLAPRNVTVQELAETYITAMKKIQPLGPYYIIGWSLGGTIAYEIAAQLEQMNQQIAFLALIDAPAPSKIVWQKAEEFNLEAEFNFVKGFNIDSELEKQLKTLHQIELEPFWSLVVDYLKINNVDVDLVKKAIGDYGQHVLPNFQHLNLEESVYYLNAGRTLTNARAHYIPGGKVNSPTHFFKASQSKNIAQGQWKKYCRTAIHYYTVSGDHFSIFKSPDVVEFVQLFENVLRTAADTGTTTFIK